jgi:putative transposase
MLKRIRTIHAGLGEVYSVPRVHAGLAAEGLGHGRKRIARHVHGRHSQIA